MKTTLDLPEELIQEVKLRAVVQRRTVKDLVAEFIRQGLGIDSGTRDEPPSPHSRVSRDASGLPLIQCLQGAPASRMSVEELLALEEKAQSEEDLQRAGLPL